LSDWSGILTKNIVGSSGIELPILFASIESIDTFVSIDDFNTFSIVSPITIKNLYLHGGRVILHPASGSGELAMATAHAIAMLIKTIHF
jgi:hypothetical protein